jgi:hypothetical protein
MSSNREWANSAFVRRPASRGLLLNAAPKSFQTIASLRARFRRGYSA